MSIQLVLALVGLLGAIIGAIPTYLFMRQKARAEIDKLAAETDRTKAETDRIRFELQKTAQIPVAISETPRSHHLAHYDKFLAVGMDTIHRHLTDDNIRDRLQKAMNIRVLKTWFPENDQIEEGLISAIKKGAKVELYWCKPESKILKRAMQKRRRA